MPGIFFQPVSRRRFLRRTTQALAGAVLIRELDLSGDDSSPDEKPVRFALLSDTHLPADAGNQYRGFFPWQNLKKAVAEVIATRPEGVIIDGDAARLTGEAADYDAFKQLLAPLGEQTPVFIGLGNHDHRENFFKVFDDPSGARQKVPDKNVLVIERSALRFIILDSLFYTNKAAGLLGKLQRAWLTRHLDNSDARPTVIFVHHTLGDGDGDLLDAQRLFELVRPRAKVKAIIYGHSHKYAFSQEDGIHLINLPAVGYNFSDEDPVGWVKASFTSQGADLGLSAFGGNRAGDGKTRSLSWRS